VTDLDIPFPGLLLCETIKQKELSRREIDGAKDPMSHRQRAVYWKDPHGLLPELCP